MESLSTCKTESEMVYWKEQVDDLRAKSEEMVLILKVRTYILHKVKNYYYTMSLRTESEMWNMMMACII